MSRNRSSILASALAGVALFACTNRPLNLGEPVLCPTYDSEAKPILDASCVSCHSGATPSGGYRLDTYRFVAERRPDGSSRIPPSSDAPVLQAARNELPGHPSLSLQEGEVAALTGFVADCRGDQELSQVHVHGWMNPGDLQQFHGIYLRGTGYAFDQCTSCHGANLQGGTSGVSCIRCHPQGVKACTTCHGDPATGNPAPPRDLSGSILTSSVGVGAHQKHLTDGRFHTAYPCSSCHTPVIDPDQEGHYQTAGKADPPPAELNTVRPTPGQSFQFDSAQAKCLNAYCHQPAVDANATNQSPKWNQVHGTQAECGACHGLPPAAPHSPDNLCKTCHALAYNGLALNTAVHANGIVDIGNGQANCSACHGDATSPAPPVDLHGKTATSEPTVGAHRGHLFATLHISSAVACSECHIVPPSTGDFLARVQAPGHIDSTPPAEVFPTGAGTIARADGANPQYNAGTCAGTYCHGGGETLAADTSAGINRTPSFTGGTGQVSCGSCHGLPPSAETGHVQGSTLTGCAGCHSASITSGGAIIVTTDPITGLPVSTHINGKVDVN